MSLIIWAALVFCPSPASCQWALDLCLGVVRDDVARAAADGRCRGRACQERYAIGKAACVESYRDCLGCNR